MIQTVSELDKRMDEFWKSQSKRDAEHAEDTVLLKFAMDLFEGDTIRGIPLKQQHSLSYWLETAAGASAEFASQRARKVRAARQPNTLQLCIEEIARRNPHITTAQLRPMLNRDRFPNLIMSVKDGKIEFEDHNRRIKSARISGLKHRLSRAKKKMRSR